MDGTGVGTKKSISGSIRCLPGISRKTGGDPSSDRLHDFPGCFGAVHGIEVDAVCAVGLQILKNFAQMG